MDRVSSPQGGRRRLAEAEGPDLARLPQPAQVPPPLLDGHLGIHARLVVEVDHLHTEAPETGVAGHPDVLRPTIDQVPAARSLDLAELGGQDHALAPPPDGPPPGGPRPSSSSLWPQPYMSEESRKVTPRSRARWMTAVDAASSLA